MVIYFDLTEVIGRGLNTGIQRVAREVTRHAIAQQSESGIDVVPVVAVGKRFYALKQDTINSISGGFDLPTHPSARDRFGLVGLLKRLALEIPPLFVFIQHIKFTRKMRALSELYHEMPIEFTNGDRLVLIDSFWTGGTALIAANVARRAGAKIIAVIYDLIPIHHPDVVSRVLAVSFTRAITRIVLLADGFVTISRTVRDALIAYEPTTVNPRRVQHFYLGHNAISKLVPAQVDDVLLPENFLAEKGSRYLMLGAIEPRKGHSYALTAFEQLWAKGGHQRLLIIGKVGGKVDHLIERLRGHPELGRRLFLMHHASDTTVSRAMAVADAMVMASFFEGFGLPLVEGLSAGVPAIAADTAIFREIGGKAALFFTVGDSDALVEAIGQFEQDKMHYRDLARDFEWIDWDESARAFGRACDDVLSARAAS